MDDFIKVLGNLHVRAYKSTPTGNILIEEINDKNKVVSLGKSKLGKLLSNNGVTNHITSVSFGTSGIAPTVKDTLITNPVSKTIIDYTEITEGVTFNFKLELADPDIIVKEYGLMCSDGTLFARKTGATIDKKADIFIDGKWTIKFI